MLPLVTWQINCNFTGIQIALLTIVRWRNLALCIRYDMRFFILHVATEPVKSLNTPTHSRDFLNLLYCRIIVKTSQL
jgi:hypothetical protein